MVSDRALDEAHQLLHAALDAYRREQRSGGDQVSPRGCVERVRGCMDEAADRGGSLSVAMVRSSLSAPSEIFGPDAERFLVGEVVGGGHGLALLQHDAPLLDGSGRDRLSDLSARGVSVKVVPGQLRSMQTPSMVVVGSELVLTRGSRPGGDNAVELIRDRVTVLALSQLTAMLDEAAVDFDEWSASASLLDIELTAEVLGRLCAGMKDETSARQMNVSVRTYRRHVAAIMKVLGVKSRFEAGLRIGELGMAPACRALAQAAEAGGSVLDEIVEDVGPRGDRSGSESAAPARATTRPRATACFGTRG